MAERTHTVAAASRASALETAASAAGQPVPTDALNFLRVVGRLKRVARTGWVHRGVQAPESVAEHSYRMAMACFLLPDGSDPEGGGGDAPLDRAKAMRIALVHDLAESLVGDIAPHQGVSDEEKHRREAEAMQCIAKEHLASCPRIGRELVELWEEYEQASSPEARWVKQIDKLEMIVQADEYEREEEGMELGEFFDSTAGYFTHPQVGAWDSELRAQRQARREASPQATADTVMDSEREREQQQQQQLPQVEKREQKCT